MTTITIFLAILFPLITLYATLYIGWLFIKLIGYPLKNFWRAIFNLI